MKNWKKETITIKNLDNAALKITGVYDGFITARTRYNHHIIHISFYKELPQYEGWEPVQVTSKVLIHEWYHLDNEQAVHDELLKLNEVLFAA